jgi:hypothetical protein
MRVAIHQPNFVPWLPFFAKMAAVDTFVILTKCQFNREHYQHRFKYQDRWYTMGVTDVRHPDLIENRRYANPVEDWEKIKRRLPRFSAWLGQFDACIGPILWETNLKIITRIAALLDIHTEIIVDPNSSLTGTDRLVEICYCLGAKTYLAGRSGANYMDESRFAAVGIKVEHQEVTDTRHVFELCASTELF